jgi:hypothetical protein
MDTATIFENDLDCLADDPDLAREIARRLSRPGFGDPNMCPLGPVPELNSHFSSQQTAGPDMFL